MSATYIYAPDLTRIQGCIEQPGTLLETSYSGLETLTFTFAGEPDNILALQQTLSPQAVVPIVGNWLNFRLISSKIIENNGVWAKLGCVAKGLRGNPPPASTTWSKQQQAIQNVIYGGQRYPTLYYLAPVATIARVELVSNGFTTEPQPASPEFGSNANVQLLTQSGYQDVQIPGAFRSCLDFKYQQTGIYWEIEEQWGITIPQPGEGTEFTFNGQSIKGFSSGPNYTSS